MNRSRHPYLIVALVLLAVACSKGDAPRADSSGTAASQSSGATASASALRTPVKQLPGELTKPLATYTGDELYAFVQGLAFTADTVKDRKCKNNPACSATKPKKIKVGVSAVVGQDSISAGTTPQFGVVYIRAINQGDAEEARYNLTPGKQFQYYVVVLPDSAGSMKWQMEQLDTTPGARRHASIGSGVFRPCPHTWTKGAGASFKTCASSAAAHDSSVKLGLLKQTLDSDSDPIWAKCAFGCCVGEI